MSNHLLYFRKDNDHQATPKVFYDALDKIYHFDFDPCPLERPEGFDGLKCDWGRMNFVNPPYSRVPPWIDKALEQRDRRGCSSVFLVPLRTNSLYWFEKVLPNCTRVFVLEKKLCFGEHEKPLPIPLCVIEFHAEAKPVLSEKNFKTIGDVKVVEFY